MMNAIDAAHGFIKINGQADFGVIEYPEDYIIGCVINRLKPHQLLQEFIDRICFATFNSTSVGELEFAANQVVSEFLKEGNNHIYIPVHHRALRIKCIKRLNAVTDSNVLSIEDKRAQLAYVLVWCRNEILKTDFQVATAYLEMGDQVDLTSNFLVICFIYGIFPERLLEYFMSKISLARFMAQIQFETSAENPFITFFLTYCKTNCRPIDATDLSFQLQLDILKQELKTEKSQKSRTVRFADLYTNWFNAVNKLSY